MSSLIASPAVESLLLTSSAAQSDISVAPPLSRGYERVKVVLDFSLALGLLLIAAPVILLTAILVKCTSRGPAFYTQLRVGRNGRVFWIYKIRTMTHNCESKTGPRWCGAGDARITAIGRFLRKTHLDELPQLWNVLRGHMSLVGPRPERPEFIPGLAQSIEGYRERLTVRPGLTGLAQVQLPADTDVESVRRKLVYDLYYIEHMGPWLDLRLMLSTALKMAHLPFSVSRKLLRIPSGNCVEKHDLPQATDTITELQEAGLQPNVV